MEMDVANPVNCLLLEYKRFVIAQGGDFMIEYIIYYHQKGFVSLIKSFMISGNFNGS